MLNSIIFFFLEPRIWLIDCNEKIELKRLFGKIPSVIKNITEFGLVEFHSYTGKSLYSGQAQNALTEALYPGTYRTSYRIDYALWKGSFKTEWCTF